MAVVDFRSGGFVGAQPRQVRDYPYGQDSLHDTGAEWSDQDRWDDADYHADGAAQGDGSVLGRVSRLTHYLGAVVSVGLMVMLVVWGYKLVMRDVSGVPVIRAIEGEARITPDNPGGEIDGRTGLAVNSVAGGVEPRPVNQVAIAPEAVGLAAEDLPMGEFGATARAPSQATEQPVLAPVEPLQPMTNAEVTAAIRAAEEMARNSTASVPPASEEAVNSAVTDLEGHVAAPESINEVLAEVAAAEPVQHAVAQSARPAPRPRRVDIAPLVAEAAAPAAPAPAPAAVAETAPTPRVSPSAIASGAPLVQIGAFDSNALAEGEWGRISGKFGSAFAGKAQVIQKIDRNGRSFWRLRVAGFESRDEARRFCATLIAGGTDCIPATAN